FREVKPEQVFMGSGSDEAIDLLIRAVCEPGKDSILITPPTYGMYKVSAGINDNAVISVPLTPAFQLRTEAIFNEVTDATKIIFLCSPNNPTANLLNQDDILEIVERFDGLVVVDEAYIDFSEQPSYAGRVSEYPNLVVLQTLSKAFGMAGARLGIAIASEEVINVILKIKAPYNINKLTAQAGLQALERLDEMKATVHKIYKEKCRLISEFGTFKDIRKVFPSDANFILIQVVNAKELYRKLAANGVIVRYRGDQIHCEETLRVTVGTRDENDALLHNLRQIIS
ncbi:MAG: histidinol-phosphate transaminase, partial [Balneolales bacterium]